MEGINDLIHQLETAIATLQQVVDKFPIDDRDKVLFDQWSLKDILAHFSGWNILTISELTMLQDGIKVEKWTGGMETDEFNKESVGQRKLLSWADVYSEFITTQKALLQKYRELTKENWSAQFGPSENDTPLRSIKIDIKHIGYDHIAQIKSNI